MGCESPVPLQIVHENGAAPSDEDSHDAADYDDEDNDDDIEVIPIDSNDPKTVNGHSHHNNQQNGQNGHADVNEPDDDDGDGHDDHVLAKSIKQLELDLRNEEAKLILLKRLYYSQRFPTQQTQQNVLKQQQHVAQQQQHMKQQHQNHHHQQQLQLQQQRGVANSNRNQMDIMNKNRKVCLHLQSILLLHQTLF
jgi:hypothetical protein